MYQPWDGVLCAFAFCVHGGVHFRGSGDHKEVWFASRKKRKSVFLPATGINTSFFFIHSFPFLLPYSLLSFPLSLGFYILVSGVFVGGWGDWVTAVIGVCFCLTTCRLVGRLVLFGPVACFVGLSFNGWCKGLP